MFVFVYVCALLCMASTSQGVINGTYAGCIGGPTTAQENDVIQMTEVLATTFKTSFFRKAKILTRASVMAAMTPSVAPVPGVMPPAPRNDVEGYKAGIIVLALLTFFLIIGLVVVSVMKQRAATQVWIVCCWTPGKLHVGALS